MFILTISKAIKTMSIHETKDFIFINFYNQIGFYKKMSYISLKPFNKKDYLFCVQINKKYTSSLQC